MNKIRKGKTFEFSKTTGGDIYEYVEENDDNFGLIERYRPYEIKRGEEMRYTKDNTLIRTIEKVGGEIIATPFDFIYILVRKKGDYQAVMNIITDFVSCYKNKAIGEFDYTLQEGYHEGYIACIYNKECEIRK